MKPISLEEQRKEIVRQALLKSMTAWFNWGNDVMFRRDPAGNVNLVGTGWDGLTTYIVEDLVSFGIIEINDQDQGCKCEMTVLMTQGCKCGAFKAEKKP